MRNLVIAGVIGVAGVTGYMLSQQGTEPTLNKPAAVSETQRLLEAIPADTVIFSGQLEPFPLKNYLKNTTYPQSEMPPELIYELEKDREPQGLFVSSLLKSYFEASKSGEAFQKLFGLSDEFVGAFYMVGALPVMRYQAGDKEAIWRLLDKAEQESGLQHELKTVDGLNYRSYMLSFEHEKPFELLVATDGNWVTVTLNGELISEKDLKVAFALEKPEQSLHASGKVQAIKSQHNFLPHSIAYIDHQELVTAFTSKEGNALARMLSKLADKNASNDDLNEIRSTECRTEMSEIASSWPRTVIGLKEMTITEDRSYMEASMIVESNNSPLMTALASMQGYIPSYLKESQVLGFGFGIDANKINPALSSIWSNTLNTEYKCKPLQNMQTSLRQSNPAALAMFTGMVQGVKGVGFAIKDFAIDLNGHRPDLTYLDALVTLSADNPEVLFNMAKTFAPHLASVELPADGSAVDLSAYMPPNPNSAQLQPMLALKGKHLVIYTGERSRETAEALQSEQPVSNGVMNLSADYKRFFTPLVPVMQMNAGPEVAEQFNILKDIDMKIRMDVTFSEKGIEMNTVADMKGMNDIAVQ